MRFLYHLLLLLAAGRLVQCKRQVPFVARRLLMPKHEPNVKELHDSVVATDKRSVVAGRNKTNALQILFRDTRLDEKLVLGTGIGLSWFGSLVQITTMACALVILFELYDWKVASGPAVILLLRSSNRAKRFRRHPIMRENVVVVSGRHKSAMPSLTNDKLAHCTIDHLINCLLFLCIDVWLLYVLLLSPGPDNLAFAAGMVFMCILVDAGNRLDLIGIHIVEQVVLKKLQQSSK